MKAWIHSQTSTTPWTSLTLETRTMPTIKPRDILVQVKGVATNPVDAKVLSPGFFGAATNEGDIIEGGKVVGWDAAGTVVSVGDSVKLFQVGDDVFFAGDIMRDGCFAEYVAVDERVVGHKPRSVGFGDAAGMPLTALTVWEGFTESMGVEDGRGKSCLVIGGAGGVGSLALQVAKKLLNFDVVIGTASREETVEFCKENGADIVINHHQNLKEQLAEHGIQGVDVVYNTSHNNWEEATEVLGHLGKILLLAEDDTLSILPLKVRRCSIHWELMFSKIILDDHPESQGEILNKFARLIDLGIINPRIRADHRFLMKDLPQAYQLQNSGKAIGKIVLTWEQE